jgi:hypothetical protein
VHSRILSGELMFGHCGRGVEGSEGRWVWVQVLDVEVVLEVLEALRHLERGSAILDDICELVLKLCDVRSVLSKA